MTERSSLRYTVPRKGVINVAGYSALKTGTVVSEDINLKNVNYARRFSSNELSYLGDWMIRATSWMDCLETSLRF